MLLLLWKNQPICKQMVRLCVYERICIVLLLPAQSVISLVWSDRQCSVWDYSMGLWAKVGQSDRRTELCNQCKLIYYINKHIFLIQMDFSYGQVVVWPSFWAYGVIRLIWFLKIWELGLWLCSFICLGWLSVLRGVCTQWLMSPSSAALLHTSASLFPTVHWPLIVARVRYPKHNTALMAQTWSQFGLKSVQKPGPVGRLHSLMCCLVAAHFRPNQHF